MTTTNTTTGNSIAQNEQNNQHQQDAQSRRLLTIAEDAKFFRTPGGEAFAEIPVMRHHEVYSVRHRAVKDWLLMKYYQCYNSTPNQNTLNSVLQLLESRARFSEDVHEVYIRVAGQNGKVYLDLCNDNWQVIEIDTEGWRVIDDCPVKFRRANGMLPLPRPVEGGSINELRPLLNYGTEEDFVLLIGTLVGMFSPDGPYPILNMNGEQGCAKSTNARLIRGLIDPNQAMTHRQPRDSENMHGTANSSWVLSYDNISRMQQWLSDMLCGMATGSGDGRRQLYSDNEQVIFSAKRPCIINGIEEIAVYGDLMDRCVTVILPVIPESRRVSERELNARYKEAQPRILSALLDAVSCGLRNRDNVQLPTLPRMADFALWVTACEEALGWAPLTFHRVYTRNRAEARSSQVEVSPVASAIIKLLEKADGHTWSGTAALLYETLRNLDYVPESVLRTTWPKTANQLGNDLTRVTPALRSQGIEVEKVRSGKTRTIVLTMSDDDCGNCDNPASPPRHPLKAVYKRLQGINDNDDNVFTNFTTTTSFLEKKREERVKEGETSSQSSQSSQTPPQADLDNDNDFYPSSPSPDYIANVARLNSTPLTAEEAEARQWAAIATSPSTSAANEEGTCEHGDIRWLCDRCTLPLETKYPIDVDFEDEEGIDEWS